MVGYDLVVIWGVSWILGGIAWIWLWVWNDRKRDTA